MVTSMVRPSPVTAPPAVLGIEHHPFKTVEDHVGVMQKLGELADKHGHLYGDLRDKDARLGAGTVLGNLAKLTKPSDPTVAAQGKYGFVDPQTGLVRGYLGKLPTADTTGLYSSPQIDAIKGDFRRVGTGIHGLDNRGSGTQDHAIASDDDGRSHVIVWHHQEHGPPIPLHFWNSSGTGGKTGTQSGGWYYTPGSSAGGKWVGKLDGHETNYDHPVLQFYADQLNRLVGNVSSSEQPLPGGATAKNANYNGIMARLMGHVEDNYLTNFATAVSARNTHPDVAAYTAQLGGPTTASGQTARGMQAVIGDYAFGSSHEKLRQYRDQSLTPEQVSSGRATASALWEKHNQWLRDNLRFPTVKSMRPFPHAIWPNGRR